MPRELRTELQTLINSGHCNWHTTLDLTLTGGIQLYFSTAEMHPNRFGKNQQYIAKIRSTEALALSVDIEIDGFNFKLANVDMVMGRILTSSSRRLDGAEAIVGILFIDRANTLANAIWDAKLPGIITAGEVSDEDVDFSLVSSIDSIIVSGRTIANEFQWQEPVSNVPTFDPNDMAPITVGGINNPIGGGGAEEAPIPRRGRYGDWEPGLNYLNF